MMQVTHACCRFKQMFWVGMWIGMAGLAVTLVSSSFQSTTLADAKTPKALRHVVEFQFKETSSKEDIQKVVDGFRALPSKISAVADFEYGVDNSPEGLANGFTHCFLLTFHSEADRDTYLKHSEHTKFVDVLKPHLEKAQVIDYWAEK